MVIFMLTLLLTDEERSAVFCVPLTVCFEEKCSCTFTFLSNLEVLLSEVATLCS